MPQFKNYDPGRVKVVFRGIELQGFADGEFVKAARAEATFKTAVGAGGDVVRIRSRNKLGTVVVTLQASSSTNDLLAASHELDEETGLGTGPLLIKDLNGTALVTAKEAWIEKPADMVRGTDGPNSEWTIACGEIAITNGGHVV